MFKIVMGIIFGAAAGGLAVYHYGFGALGLILLSQLGSNLCISGAKDAHAD